MAREDKLKALDAAISQIEKQYGKGSIMKLGDNSAHMNVETIPTGSLSLDIALGLGGLPKGRIIEIYGPESSGKTTVALHAVAEVQKRGGIAGFIDAEHALDPAYAKNIGVNIDELYISQPDCGEQALEITETMVRSGAVDIVIVDSVAALVPKAEIDGDMGDSHVGLQARLMSQALRKLTAVISKSNCIVIFINQLREKVGVMFGNPETTTGGTEMVATLIQHYYKHYSVVQIIQFLDGAVVIAGLFVFGVHVALYAIVAIFVTSKVSDALMEGLKFSKAAFIITDHYDQVAKRIMTELERGVTGLHAKGMYSGAEKCMLYCVVSRKEIVQVKEIVSEVDPDAFVIVSDAREVLGEGFQEQMS